MRVKRISTLAFLLSLGFVCATNLASAAPAKIAVLELRNDSKIKSQEVAYLTDLVRSAALTLPAGAFLVMTRENILEFLPPGTSLAECQGACEVETGRNVGAAIVATGHVIRFGRSLKVTLKIYETKSGKLLGSEIASADTIDTLEKPVQNAAKRLFTRLSPPPPNSVSKSPLKANSRSTTKQT